jgi:Fe(3+) dicitrate transport protein
VTVGGVVNYITPDPTEHFGGKVVLIGGNRNYFNGWTLLSGTHKGIGWLLDYQRKQGEGSRENVRSGLNDATLKLTRAFGNHQFTLKGNFYGEDSNVAYSGLRLDEYLANPRQNPFRNDFFYGRRHGVTLRHSVPLRSNILLTTNIYGAVFTRDWWRQSSNSNQRPNDAADAACGGMANLNTTCGNEGRLRQYHTVGFDPHLRIGWKLFGLRSETDLGFRGHFEKQYRLQLNGPLPTSRSGVEVEDNIRRTQAYSTFVQNKFVFGRLAITPGVRIEQINYSRNNRVLNVQGRNDLVQAVPGLGAAFAVTDRFTIFAGAHRGFAPPRVEDVITNGGGLVELDPELSWNYEVGFRSNVIKGLRFDATYFRMDYENQIVPASLAGGVGAALTNGGATRHQGFEISSRFDAAQWFGQRYAFFVSASYTHLPTAQFDGVRFSNIPGFSTVSVTGNRLPYAPENTLTGSFGYSHPKGWDVMMEAVFIGDQFGDDLNSVVSSPDGQRGLLPGYTTWNATFNYRLEKLRSNLFITAKNVFDQTAIVDRARGILPNSPRLLQSGLRFSF